jgi:hypothetical protein
MLAGLGNSKVAAASRCRQISDSKKSLLVKTSSAPHQSNSFGEIQDMPYKKA